jgi:TPR repeat protein
MRLRAFFVGSAVIVATLGCVRARAPGEPGEGAPHLPFPPGITPCRDVDACRAACEAPDAHADRCAALGFHRYLGIDTPMDRPKAVEAFELACRLQSNAGCFGLGVALYQGGGIARDRSKALDYFHRACTGGLTRACVRWAEMLRAGDSVAEDDTRAAAIEEAACSSGDAEACADVGDDHDKGYGLAKDEESALKFWTRACEGGSGYGCFCQGLAIQNGTSENDIENAIEVFDKGCRLGGGEACDELGRLATVSRNYFYVADLERAARYFDWACALEDATGCFNLATAYLEGEGVDKSASRAARLLYRGCGLDDGRSCEHLGTLVETGADGLPADLAAAPLYYERACRLRDMDGCVSLGLCYRDGVGVEKNAAKATELFAKACTQGDGAACDRKDAMKQQ